MQGRNSWVLLSLTILLLSASAQAVVIDGRDWRQPADTLGFSWDDLATLFDPQTGQLIDPSNTTLTRASDGAVIDFAGWTWASVYEVADMFEAAGLPGCPNPCSIASASAAWAPAFLDTDGAGIADDGLFYATGSPMASYSLVHGLTRTTMFMPSMVFAPLVKDTEVQGMSDMVSTGLSWNTNFTSSETGVWLFRDVTFPVPVPAPVGLLVLGALVLWPRLSRTAAQSRSGRAIL